MVQRESPDLHGTNIEKILQAAFAPIILSIKNYKAKLLLEKSFRTKIAPVKC